MSNIIKEIEQRQLRKDIPVFRVGDKVRVEEKIVEQDTTRIQAFEGVIIARKGGGLSETFTVRKISHGEGVEKIFPLHSPLINSIEVIRKGKVRRAKLYYLRKKVGRGAKVEEKEEIKESIDTDDASVGTQTPESELS